jgi:hypothetical protein
MLSDKAMQAILQTPQSGGKAWRKQNPEQVFAWPSTNVHYCIDMDTPQDIAKLALEHGIQLNWGQIS